MLLRRKLVARGERFKHALPIASVRAAGGGWLIPGYTTRVVRYMQLLCVDLPNIAIIYI